MEKPKGYDDTQAQMGFVPVELGGHHLIIKQVNEKKSKNNQDMIVVLFDFAQNDTQAGYFMEQFKNDIRPEKKYPNQATEYIMVYDQDGKTSRKFKTFTTCIEHSNPGFAVQWGNGFCQQFKDKKCGGVFGEQMDYYNGKEIRKRVLRWFTSSDKVSDAVVPGITQTQAHKEYMQSGGATPIPGGDFMNIPDAIEDELPFN